MVIPQGVELPPDTAAVVERWQVHGRVVRDDASAATRSKAGLIESLQPTLRIAPATDTIALGRFVRDGRTILLLVNVGSDAYTGQLVTAEPCSWLRLDPSGGRIENPNPQPGRHHAIRLDARQALLLVLTR